MNAAQAASILSQIKSIEVQLTALKTQVQEIVEQNGEKPYTFADLYGLTAGEGNFSEEEIDAVLYREPPNMDEYYPLLSEKANQR